MDDIIRHLNSQVRVSVRRLERLQGRLVRAQDQALESTNGTVSAALTVYEKHLRDLINQEVETIRRLRKQVNTLNALP